MFPALQVPRRAVRLGQRVLVMPRVMLHRCCTSAAASTHVSPSGFAVCTAGLEPIFWQKTPFLGGSYLSFGKSKNFFFFFFACFAKSSDLQVGAFWCRTSPAVCLQQHGQGHGWGVGAPPGKNPHPEGAWGVAGLECFPSLPCQGCP